MHSLLIDHTNGQAVEYSVSEKAAEFVNAQLRGCVGNEKLWVDVEGRQTSLYLEIPLGDASEFVLRENILRVRWKPTR